MSRQNTESSNHQPAKRRQELAASGGFDCELINPPLNNLMQYDCPICTLILCEPCQMECCGKNYCRGCIQLVSAKINSSCPTCNGKNFRFYFNKDLKQRLYAQKVYCSNNREGCKWEGELGQLQHHLNIQPAPDNFMEGCRFSKVECDLCHDLFQRHYIDTHQSSECIKRSYRCQYCMYPATYEEIQQAHLPNCADAPHPCPNKCKQNIPLKDMGHHTSHDCPLGLLKCDFYAVGCLVQLPRGDMSSHYRENMIGHNSLLQRHIQSDPQEVWATCLPLLLSLNHRLLVDNTSIHSEMRTLQDEKAILQQSVSKLELENKELKMGVSEQKYMLENITFTGTLPFEFTITDFNVLMKREVNKEWFSPPFYTHTRGYKMKIRVDVNGEAGSYLSVYGYLMRGEYDEALQWPFQGIVTVQLCNQLGYDDHWENVIKFTTDPRMVSRVVGQNIADYGAPLPKFIAHSMLDVSRQSPYLKENTLKFKVLKVENINPAARLHNRCLTLESMAGTIENIAPVTFILTDYDNLRKNDGVWFSPAFYAHSDKKYKLCLRVHPNGYRESRGAHISICTCLMGGIYDDSLKWPFQGKITIEILSQSSTENFTFDIEYTKEAKSYADKQVERKISRAYGVHKSLPLDDLCKKYVKNDALRIRISKVLM